MLSPKYTLERKSEVASSVDRTLLPVSIDPDDPLVLTPVNLFIQKVSTPIRFGGIWSKRQHHTLVEICPGTD